MTNQGKIHFISVVSDKPQFHNSGKSSLNSRTKILFPVILKSFPVEKSGPVSVTSIDHVT